MVKRTRLTDLEAHAVKTRKSEPVGSRGKGTLLLERKASGVILAYYRERTLTTDQRLSLGILAKRPRLDANEYSLSSLRDKAATLANGVEAAGGIAGYLAEIERQKAHLAESETRAHRAAEVAARRGSFGDLMDSYSNGMVAAGKVSAKEISRMFQLHVKDYHPDLVSRPAADIQPEDIQLILAGVLGRKPKGRGIGHKAPGSSFNGMRTTCDKLRRYLRAAFSYAARAHLAPERLAEDGKVFAVSANPVRDIPVTLGTGQGHTESLTPTELGELLRHLDTLPVRHAAIAKALIYFGGQRLTQFCAVPWEAVSDTTISLLDSKGRKAQAWEHLLPITERIKEVIQPLLNDRIGPGPFSLTPGSFANPNTLSNIYINAGRSLLADGKAQSFTWKNVRVTAETLLAHQGVSAEVRAWLLSHGRSGVQAKHYDRYSYLPEKQAALEKWGRYLDGLASGKEQVDNVVLLSRRKKKEADSKS
ncbi:tyrosine-type recombinase/integrase [Pseudomonas petrae]|uniref:tyrosine-type recombinase/integrase n=1 Tax=Pseudomonas petrae TaxID=2912190 RepID=UPI001F4117A9|nr:integrase [Pseudomonas petrae]MCF7555127.1 integrase [Pseudomonas petrae]